MLVAMERGWVAYGPTSSSGPGADDPLRPELADLGRLARRGMRAVVGAARAEDRPRLSRILAEHLGPGVGELDVVEEAWPAYDHVNVQTGLDAWLAASGRTSELVGVVSQHGQPVDLAQLLTQE